MKRRLTVRFGDRDLTKAGFTHDVSAGGLFVITDGHVPSSGRLHIQLFLNKDEFVLLEGVAVREKQVPPELRQVARGGFGVRLLSPTEILIKLVPDEGAPGPDHFVIEYQTASELRRAHDAELRHGGVFVPTMTVLPRDATATVQFRLPFVARAVDCVARVIHISEGGGGGMRGLGLAFEDKAKVLGELTQHM